MYSKGRGAWPGQFPDESKVFKAQAKERKRYRKKMRLRAEREQAKAEKAYALMMEGETVKKIEGMTL